MAIQLTYKLDLSATAASSTLSNYAARVGTASISTAQNTAIFSTDTGNGADVWFSSDQAGLSPIDAKLIHWSDANSVFAFDVEITTVSAISGATIYLHVGSKPGGYGTDPYKATDLSHWPLIDNANDSAGSNNGTAIGTAFLYGAETHPDGVLPATDFGQVTASDPASQYIDVAPPGQLTSGYVQGWAKLTYQIGDTTDFIYADADFESGRRLYIGIGTTGRAWARLGGSSPVVAGTAFAAGVAQHVALSWSSGTAQLYQNGVKVADYIYTGTPGSTLDDRTAIGTVRTAINTTSRSFDGIISDVKLGSATRSAAEINADYLLQGPSAATHWTVTKVSTSPIRRIKYGKLSGIIGNPLRGHIG